MHVFFLELGSFECSPPNLRHTQVWTMQHESTRPKLTRSYADQTIDKGEAQNNVAVFQLSLNTPCQAPLTRLGQDLTISLSSKYACLFLPSVLSWSGIYLVPSAPHKPIKTKHVHPLPYFSRPDLYPSFIYIYHLNTTSTNPTTKMNSTISFTRLSNATVYKPKTGPSSSQSPRYSRL